MNGKGDSPRPVNGEVYRENFDFIFRRKPRDVWEDPKIMASWEGMNVEKESHLAFMRSQGFTCSTEEEAYRLRGLLDL